MNRVLFIIFNNMVQYASDPNMDHRELYLSLGGNADLYENTIRGFVMDGKIIFFRNNFSYDNEVIENAKKFAPLIRSKMGNESLVVCCGLLAGAPGQKWETILTLTEDEIRNYRPPQQKIDTNIPKLEKDLQPVIDFKNNYDDPKFIKSAIIFTIVILILSIIIDIILIKTKSFNSLFDYLLVIGQIVLLVMSIIGYKNKKENTKFISIGASVFLILVFNVFDIILGVLYLLFTVDSSYFTKLINLLKNIKK